MENNLDELVLGRPDLIEMEDRLCRLLSPFLSFSGHALYFPIENFPEEIELLPRERRLLLPLLWRGEKLGVLLLNGVKAAARPAAIACHNAIVPRKPRHAARFKLRGPQRLAQ